MAETCSSTWMSMVRRALAGAAASAIAAASLVVPTTVAVAPALAASCVQSISGTIKNQFGNVPKGASLTLTAEEHLDDDEGDYLYIADIDASGRFHFDRNDWGPACVPAEDHYVMTVTSAYGEGVAQGAPWYWGDVWRGKLAKDQHLKLSLVGQLLGRIKTTTTGASDLRAPAYKVYDTKTNKLAASTDPAPRLNGVSGSSNYVSVPAGTYRVVMSPRAADDIKPVGATTKNVTVRAGQTSTANFAMRPGGAITGKITNPVGLITDATDSSAHYDPYSTAPGDITDDVFYPGSFSRYPPDCDAITKSAGYVVIARQGKQFTRTACMSKAGGINLRSLPAGKYTMRVYLHAPGFENGRYLTKNGKKRLLTVTEGSTTKAGRITLPGKYPMVRGTITLPKVAGAQCVVSLYNSRGKNATAGSFTSVRTSGGKTKISYRVWANSTKKAAYRVRYTCMNDVRYIQAWKMDSLDSLSTHDTWYSGGAKRLAKAKPVTLAGTKTKSVNVTLKGSKRAEVGTPTITGTAKVGGTLGVKVPGLAKGAKTYVRWLVNGHVTDAYISIQDRGHVFRSKRTLALTSKLRGARVQAQVVTAQNKHWTVVKTTKAVSVS